jgi:hypothetical protein
VKSKDILLMAVLASAIRVCSIANAGYNGLSVGTVDTTVALDPTNPALLTPVMATRNSASF